MPGVVSPEQTKQAGFRAREQFADILQAKADEQKRIVNDMADKYTKDFDAEVKKRAKEYFKSLPWDKSAPAKRHWTNPEYSPRVAIEKAVRDEMTATQEAYNKAHAEYESVQAEAYAEGITLTNPRSNIPFDADEYAESLREEAIEKFHKWLEENVNQHLKNDISQGITPPGAKVAHEDMRNLTNILAPAMPGASVNDKVLELGRGLYGKRRLVLLFYDPAPGKRSVGRFALETPEELFDREALQAAREHVAVNNPPRGVRWYD
jgi:hypothetical protein